MIKKGTIVKIILQSMKRLFSNGATKAHICCSVKVISV